MTKLLQFVGGFLLSFLLIVGLFTGIFWFTKDYTPPPPSEMDLDSLYANGAYPDSISQYKKERMQISHDAKQLTEKEAEVQRREQELAERQKLLQDLQSKTADARAEEDSIMNIRYEELAKLIESMKPVDAGPVLNNLSDFAAAKILIKMKKRQAGRIMNVMDVNKVASVSQLITMLKN